jgi:cytochrome c biogenesis protein CcdA
MTVAKINVADVSTPLAIAMAGIAAAASIPCDGRVLHLPITLASQRAHVLLLLFVLETGVRLHFHLRLCLFTDNGDVAKSLPSPFDIV